MASNVITLILSYGIIIFHSSKYATARIRHNRSMLVDLYYLLFVSYSCSSILRGMKDNDTIL